MMPEQKQDDGGPAFPLVISGFTTDIDGKHEPTLLSHDGMSLRDYFAAKAMQALLARTDMDFVFAQEDDLPDWNACGKFRHEDVLASMSYNAADAMLQAREQ